MAKDEEERAEAREVEKDEKVMYHCDQCGKNYAYLHKLKHHMTWLCKERAQRLDLKVEPRRELSSNIYHLPTIDESEEEGDNDMKEEKVEDGEGGCELEKEPDERSAREEEEEYILKGEVRSEELNLSVTSGSVAPQVMIYQAQHDYPKYLKVFCCAQCNKPFSSKSAAKNHRRRKCKGVEVISLCDI